VKKRFLWAIVLTGGCLMNITSANTTKNEVATFAGGCFWCMEPPFEGIKGVLSVTAGYMGGPTVNPTYEQVCTGETGHAEAVQVTFDPTVVTYSELLEIFWRNIDPTTENAQFADQGTQYRTAVFFHSEEQKRLAEVSKRALAASGKFTGEIVTEIVPASTYYMAEDDHQDYFKKQPFRYKNYSVGSGRAGFIEKTWGKSK
jgi:peptide methionine sulfoxide reductase msrA/msrB